MLFFKSKQKSQELLPPPPPDDPESIGLKSDFDESHTEELQQELLEKPAHFDKLLSPIEGRMEESPEEEEFSKFVGSLKDSKPMSELKPTSKSSKNGKKAKDRKDSAKEVSVATQADTLDLG